MPIEARKMKASESTHVAIQMFRRTEQAKADLDRVERTLTVAVSMVPEDDMPYYVESTEKILRRFDEREAVRDQNRSGKG